MTEFMYHQWIEILCLALAVGIAPMLSNLLIRSPNHEGLKWLNIWYLYAGGLTLAHIVLAFMYVGHNDSAIPLSYLVGQTVDPLIAIFAVYPALYSIKNKWSIHLGITIYAAFMWYLAVTLTDAHGSGDIGRPQDLITVVVSFIALIGFAFAPSVYGRLMFFGVLMTFIGSLFMVQSNALYDINFIIAHWFKVFSYLVMNIVILYLHCTVSEHTFCKPVLDVVKKIRKNDDARATITSNR